MCMFSFANFHLQLFSWSLFRYLSSTNVVFDSKSNVISRRLGIPERPKKPISSYLRFLQEVRPTLQQSEKNVREIPVMAAAQWKKLDANQKQKYIQEYEKEKVFLSYSFLLNL